MISILNQLNHIEAVDLWSGNRDSFRRLGRRSDDLLVLEWLNWQELLPVRMFGSGL